MAIEHSFHPDKERLKKKSQNFGIKKTTGYASMIIASLRPGPPQEGPLRNAPSPL
jgi:hypothetical protein